MAKVKRTVAARFPINSAVERVSSRKVVPAWVRRERPLLPGDSEDCSASQDSTQAYDYTCFEASGEGRAASCFCIHRQIVLCLPVFSHRYVSPCLLQGLFRGEQLVSFGVV